MKSLLRRSGSLPNRTTLFVDREVQSGVAKTVGLHWTAFIVCNLLGLLLWVRLFERPELAWGEVVSQAVARFAPFLIVSLVLLPAFIFDTLKMTHRFAGPISRLRSELKRACSGRPVCELKFRDNDYWREIANGFNELTRRAGLERLPTASDASAGGPRQRNQPMD